MWLCNPLMLYRRKQHYPIDLNNSILVIGWRGVPGDADTCAIVAPDCQNCNRLRRSTWG